MSQYTISPLIKSRKVEDLVELPSTILVNQFTEDSAKKFREDMDKALNINTNKIIPIVIDSYGGQVYSLLSMFDCIVSTKNKGYIVPTISTGKSMSCGAMLFCSGTEGYRYIDKYSTLMIHEVSSGNHGKVEEIKVDAKETDRLNQLIFHLAAESIGKPKNYLLDIIHDKNHADWYLDADECIKHNVANHIGFPSFKVNITAEILFG